MLGIGCIPLWLAEFSTRSNTCQKTMKEMHKYSGSCYWEAITRPFLTKIGSKNVCGLWIMDYGCIILGVIRLAREREKTISFFLLLIYCTLCIYICRPHRVQQGRPFLLGFHEYLHIDLFKQNCYDQWIRTQPALKVSTYQRAQSDESHLVGQRSLQCMGNTNKKDDLAE